MKKWVYQYKNKSDAMHFTSARKGDMFINIFRTIY